MKTVHVDLGSRSYRVVIGSRAASQLATNETVTSAAGRTVVITDETVSRIWLDEIRAALPGEPRVFRVPPGEDSKTLPTVGAICTQLANWRIDRAGLVIALGGGVVGDLAGFVAAVWNRGIRFIQVPTTLLAAIDASVGGKTGVNLAAGKNLVGAFHQPQLVVVDTRFLTSLPSREFIAGLAESVKHAVICDPGFVDWHEASVASIAAREDGTLTELISRNCAIKAGVVSRDEREAELRAILNYGHTVAHALEATLEYELLHGECVGVGMIVENEIAVARSLLARGDADRIQSLITALGLPVRLPRRVDEESVWRYCLVDKKNDTGAVNCVLVRAIGEPVRVRDVAASELAAALPAIQP